MQWVTLTEGRVGSNSDVAAFSKVVRLPLDS